MKRILLIGTFLAAVGPLASGTVQAAHAQNANHTAPSPYKLAWHESLSQMPASLAAAVRRAIPPSSGPYFSTGDFFPGDGANGDEFGYAVALSADGDVALVGASQKEINGTLNGNKVVISRGAAYVFTRHGGSYVQTAELTERATKHSPNPITSVGRAVALSSDGHIALVGADGAAFVFAASGTKYRQMAKLAAAGTHDDSFGFAVALNATGNTALVGDSFQSVGGNSAQGVAYVFRHQGSGYSLAAKLKAAEGKANDNFGLVGRSECRRKHCRHRSTRPFSRRQECRRGSLRLPPSRKYVQAGSGGDGKRCRHHRPVRIRSRHKSKRRCPSDRSARSARQR